MIAALSICALSICAVACSGDDPAKDSAAADPCLTYVAEWSDCTVAAGEGADPTLEDPEAFCADNADESDSHWECLTEAIHEPYCTNYQGLTAIQGEFAACSGY
jgi:hypothetical protein